MTNILKWLSLASVVVFGFWGNLAAVYQTLMVFMILDMASGIIVAFTQKTLEASLAWKGVFKKGGEIVIVLMAAYIQKLVPGLSSVPLPEALAGFYIYYEGLSIIENASILGIPIPQFLRDALAKLSPEKDIPPEGIERRQSKIRQG